MATLTIIRDEKNPKVTVHHMFDDTYVASANSDPIDMKFARGASVSMEWTSEAPEKTFDAGVRDVQKATFPALVAAVAGSFLICNDTNGDSWAIATLTTLGVKDKKTETFPALAAATSGDYVVLPALGDTFWAISLDKTGTDAEPTGAIWVSVPEANKVHVDISAAVTAIEVAALVVTAFTGLTGYDAAFTVTDNLDGTVEFEAIAVGALADVSLKNADDSGAGSITSAVTVTGVDADTAPTTDKWTAIASAKKGTVDISACTDAASVAAAFEVAFDGLTGFSALVTTDDDAADGTMLFTGVANDDIGALEAYEAADVESVTIICAEETEYVPTEINITTNAITIPLHGIEPGLKGQLTSTGTLPAGLAAVTDYFVIVVDANTIKLASSLVNATAGTAVDITDYGTAGATHTFTATAIAGSSIKLQEVNDLDDTWQDVASTSTNITATDKTLKTLTNFESRYLRAVFAITAGQVALNVRACVKELV
jgi:hypothetical protein